MRGTGHLSSVFFGPDAVSAVELIAVSIDGFAEIAPTPDFTALNEGVAEVPGKPDIVRYTPLSTLVHFDDQKGLPVAGFRYEFFQVIWPERPGWVEASMTGAAYCVFVQWPSLQTNQLMLSRIDWKWVNRPQFVPAIPPA